VGVTRIDGPAFTYLLRWWWPLAALWWASAAWTLWCVAADAVRRAQPVGPGVIGPPGAPRRRLGVWAPLALGVLAVAVAAPPAVDAADRIATHDSPNERFAGAVTDAVDTTLAALGPPGRAEAGVVEVWSADEGTGWLVDALSVALERAGWEIVVLRTPMAEGKWGEARTAPIDELVWSPDSSVGTGGRRAVWVLGGGNRPAVGPVAPAVERVVVDPAGIDGAPFSVWVG